MKDPLVSMLVPDIEKWAEKLECTSWLALSQIPTSSRDGGVGPGKEHIDIISSVIEKEGN